MSNPVLLIHGCAWAIPDDLVEAHLNGVRNAVNAGWNVLEKGGSSLDAAEAAVIVMEDDEAFDAGRGSFLNREGKVQLDALIMDGDTLRAGGVGCVDLSLLTRGQRHRSIMAQWVSTATMGRHTAANATARPRRA